MLDLPEVALSAKARGPRRIFLESLAIVGVVGALAGGLVWLRRQGGPAIDPQQRQALVGPDLVEALPSPMATQPPAAPPEPAQALNTPHPEAPPVVEAPAEAAGEAAAAPEEAAEAAGGAKDGKQVIHEIKSGDTLYGIAIAYGVTLDAIVAANNVTDPTGFHVGDKLVIPLAGEAVVAAAAGGETAAAVAATPDQGAPQPIVVRAQEVYRVQPGDGLDDIAAKHNVSAKDLRAFNPSLVGETPELKAGQELVIRPAQLATATALPAGTAIPEQGQPAVAADSGADLLPALRLLSPGTEMTVADEVLLLRWSSAGILPEGLHYVVSLRDITAPLAKGPDALAALPPLDLDPDARREWVFSNATALRVPPELRPALGAKRIVEWSVTVRRAGSSGAEGILSDAAGREVRRFTWQPGAAASETE